VGGEQADKNEKTGPTHGVRAIRSSAREIQHRACGGGGTLLGATEAKFAMGKVASDMTCIATSRYDPKAQNAASPEAIATGNGNANARQQSNGSQPLCDDAVCPISK
jgi:hypothetical protein